MQKQQEQNTPKVAVIGCGHWGKNLVKNFARLGALAAVFDTDADTASKFSSAYDVPALGWEDILQNQEIDAVVIAAPAVLHAKLGLEAIAAGKHVYVEKPLALTMDDAHELVNAAKDKGRKLMVGHLLQYHLVFVKLREMVQGGELGNLQYVYSNRMSLGKFRSEENVLWSFAPHDISMILSLAQQAPYHVEAFGGSYLLEGIADNCLVKMAFPNGVKAHIQASWLHPFKEHRIVVVGDKAMAVFEDTRSWNEKLALYPHNIDKSAVPYVPQKADAVFIDVEEDEPLKCECAHFLNTIATDSVPQTDGEEGLRVLDVLQKAEACLSDSLSLNVTTEQGEGGRRHAI